MAIGGLIPSPLQETIMQSLNIHDAESVSISPMQQHNTSRWVTITIVHNGDNFEINLFYKDDLPIVLESSTHWTLTSKTTKQDNANE